MDADINNDTSFDHLTTEIEYSLLLLKDIAYDSNLMLDSEYKSYTLVDTIVSILPELIEYNGQIRAMGSSIQNNNITQKQREHITIQISKIDEKLNKLKYYMDKAEVKQTQECYQHMLDAENSFIEFAKIELLTKENIMIDPNDIFKLGTQDINYIINIYNNNSKKLKEILQKRVKEKTQISISIIFIAFASLIFILYINIQFYNKNKKFIKKIKQLSMTDGMTNLFNRRAFDTAFIKRFELAKRDKNIFVFLMLDIDYFKNYNDNYGHQSGDIALKSIAAILNSSFSRPDDTVYRLGGEEFGVLFSTNSENGAKEMAQKVLTNIENLNIEHRFSSVAQHITASIGLGIISYNNIENINTTYVKVDNALYNAKANGRNRYEVVYI